MRQRRLDMLEDLGVNIKKLNPNTSVKQLSIYEQALLFDIITKEDVENNIDMTEYQLSINKSYGIKSSDVRDYTDIEFRKILEVHNINQGELDFDTFSDLILDGYKPSEKLEEQIKDKDIITKTAHAYLEKNKLTKN